MPHSWRYRYYSNTSDSIYETDSLGKTVTAALMGIPVQQVVLKCALRFNEPMVPARVSSFCGAMFDARIG